MRNFQDTFETLKWSCNSVFSICITVPLIKQPGLQYSYGGTMKNGTLKLALFLHPDTLMVDCCINSVTQTEVGRLFGTIPQVSPTTIASREYCEKSVHRCNSWRLGHGRGCLPWSSAYKCSIFKSQQGCRYVLEDERKNLEQKLLCS